MVLGLCWSSWYLIIRDGGYAWQGLVLVIILLTCMNAWQGLVLIILLVGVHAW